MPRLSDSMEEGTVLKWLVEVGGEVARGAPLVEIETDKANMTYEADTDGVLVEVIAAEGDTLAVGEPIARIGAAGEETAAPAAEEAPPAEEEAEPVPAEPIPAQAESAPEPARAAPAAGNGGERVKASPVARRIAGELGVELAAIEGSGPGGRVVKADVEAAAGNGSAAPAQAPPAPEPEPAQQPEPAQAAPAPAPAASGEAGVKGAPEVVELTRLQRTVSRRMAESKATAPDFALEVEVDMTLCIELRAAPEGVRRHRARALLQRHDREGRGAGRARPPQGQRLLPRRRLRALPRGERGRGGGRPGRPGGAGREGRRPEVAGRDRAPGARR